MNSLVIFPRFEQWYLFVTGVSKAGMKHKISLMLTGKMHPFWLYSYILWKAVYRNSWCMCIILEANIIWCSGLQYIRPFFQISPFCTIIANVSSQFSTLQLRNMIALAACLMGMLFGCQILLSMHKKWSSRAHQALRLIISEFKYSHQPVVKKKFSCHRHFKCRIL